jgi:hypothetical protein
MPDTTTAAIPPMNGHTLKNTRGDLCPYCRSPSVVRRFSQCAAADAGGVKVPSLCDDCNKEWFLIFSLTGWTSRSHRKAAPDA